MCNICKHATLILFADETILFSYGTNLDIMKYFIDTGLFYFRNGSNSIQKENLYMILYKKEKVVSWCSLKTDGHTIHKECKTKFVGFINWTEKIYIYWKAVRGLGIITEAGFLRIRMEKSILSIIHLSSFYILKPYYLVVHTQLCQF